MEDGTKISAGNKRRVQVRKEREDAFGAAKKQVFLDHLAGCCNVRRAAAAAGVSVNTVNAHRRNDPAFAQAMREAIDFAYENVEAMALEHAARGGHYVPGPDAADAPGPEGMDIAVALHMLELRRKPMGQRTGKAGYAPRTVSAKALNESLLAKLEVLNRRRRCEKKGSPSTGSGRTGGERALKRHEVRKLKTPAQAKDALAGAPLSGGEAGGSPQRRGPSPQPSPRRGEGVSRRAR